MQDPAARNPVELHGVDSAEVVVERPSQIEMRRARYNPLEDSKLVNALPNLILRPSEKDGWTEFLASYSILRGESSRFEHLRAALRHATSQDSASQLRTFHGYFQDTYGLTDETFERDMKMLDASISAAHATIAATVEKYIPVLQQQVLKMSSQVSSEKDPVRLVHLAASRGRDIVTRITSYEAQRQLAMAQMEFELRLNGHGPDELEAILARFLERLCRDYFIPGRSERMMLIADLDPANGGMVTSYQLVPMSDPAARQLPSARLAMMWLDIRFVRAKDSDGRVIDIPVFFDGRVKEHVTLKLIRKCLRHPESISDLLGIKFVFFSEKHRDLGVARLRETVVCVPGSVFGSASNAALAGRMDPHNEHSSDEFRATKYEVRFQNQLLELMFMVASDYVNEIVSSGNVNHALYKIGAHIDRVFPVIFPIDLYGLDWSDAALRKRLRELQLSKI